MVDLDEPIKDYNSYFKEEHSKNVSAYFEELLHESNVDEQQNIATVAELRALEKGVADSSSSRRNWRIGRILLILAAIGLVGLAFAEQGFYYLAIAPAIGAIVLIFWKINPEVASLNEKVSDLEAKRDDKSGQAWLQMDPLNQMHTWDAGRKLFSRSFPQVTFDPYFTTDRLEDLMSSYGLSSGFNDGRSIYLSHSGSLNNNPFVITRFQQHWIGAQTYFGSLVIYWTETVRDAQGNWVNVQKSQTLTASVVKPFPEFQTRTSIIYSHEAAPNLSFSRTPSNLSGLDEGVLNNWRKDHAIRKVERKARKDVKTGKGNLTVMANKEFEALFNAVDRDHEVEFRLLFTPLSQQEMVQLLNDSSVGYGDNFAFEKQGMVNIVEPRHLNEMRIDCDPRLFHSQELEQARKYFNEFHNEYFRSLYFGFAPLLTVPLYREKRSLPASGNGQTVSPSCFWEHEAMANYIGEDHFKHPDSITRNLIKTSVTSRGRFTSTVEVTAYGYRGIPRIDYVPVLGGDNRIHQVPVPWTEYIEVERQSRIVVGPMSNSIENLDEPTKSEIEREWEKALSTHGIDPERVYAHGALAGAVASN